MSNPLVRVRSNIDVGRAVLHAFGTRGLARRIAYVGRVRSGALTRATPALPDFSSFQPLRWNHRFDLDEVRDGYERLGVGSSVREAVISEAKALLSGSLRFYGGEHRQVGWPPAWHRFPDGTEGPARVHWSLVSDDLPGDVKDLWEPSRFGFTFLLARAHVLTGEQRWVDAWWQAVEDWARENPPNTGVNWRCGQEASLRGIAWCFGLSVFGGHECSTPGRVDLLHRMLAATVRRVRPTVGYALSQRNNHAISELVFLLAVGPDARLERLLTEALRDQWYDDGSYSQQSLNYQRLAMHGLIWLLHVQPALQVDTVVTVRSCLATGAAFFRRCTDPVADRLPNSGANDGALLLDLDSAPRWDAGPTLDLLGAGGRRTEAGVWFPSSHLRLPPLTMPAATAFVTVRGPRSLLLTHAGPSRHRPGDDDQQSVELIVEGHPVVLDPGSYRYSGVSPWRQPFVGAEVHNAPHVPGEAGAAVGRFLREASPAARVVEHRSGDDVEVLVTERGLGRGICTRAVVRRGDEYAVVDHVAGTTATVRWLLHPDAVESVDIVATTTPDEPTRTESDPVSGWWSPLYGERRPAVAKVIGLQAGDAALLRFAPDGQPGLTFEAIRRAVSGHAVLAAGLRTLEQAQVAVAR